LNPEILQHLESFEQEGKRLLLELTQRISQAKSQKNVGHFATDLFGGKILPHGIVAAGKKLSKGVLSNRTQGIEEEASAIAENWLDSITRYVSQVSRPNTTITPKGNSTTLIRKFNHARKAVQAKTKLNRGLKALLELKSYDLVYTRDLKEILQMRKLQKAKAPKYKHYSNEIKKLLKDYPSELESFLGAIERLEQSGLDAYRQCLSSCRNCLESLVKKMAGRWPEGVITLVPSKTKQRLIKDTYRFLSAYGVHGEETPTEEDAKSGLEQTLSAVRQILSHKKRRFQA